LQGKTCRAFIAPLDVRSPKRNEADEPVGSVVQPDVWLSATPINWTSAPRRMGARQSCRRSPPVTTKSRSAIFTSATASANLVGAPHRQHSDRLTFA